MLAGMWEGWGRPTVRAAVRVAGLQRGQAGAPATAHTPRGTSRTGSGQSTCTSSGRTASDGTGTPGTGSGRTSRTGSDRITPGTATPRAGTGGTGTGTGGTGTECGAGGRGGAVGGPHRRADAGGRVGDDHLGIEHVYESNRLSGHFHHPATAILPTLHAYAIRTYVLQIAHRRCPWSNSRESRLLWTAARVPTCDVVIVSVQQPNFGLVTSG